MRDTIDFVKYARQEERHKRYIQFPLQGEIEKPKRAPIQRKAWVQPSQQVIDTTKRIYHSTVRIPMTQYLIIFFCCILSGIMIWNIIHMHQTYKQYEVLSNTYNTVVEENNRLNQIFFESYDKEYLFDVVEKYGLIPIEEAKQYIIDVENRETIPVEK